MNFGMEQAHQLVIMKGLVFSKYHPSLYIGVLIMCLLTVSLHIIERRNDKFISLLKQPMSAHFSSLMPVLEPVGHVSEYPVFQDFEALAKTRQDRSHVTGTFS